jgi:hypothetical protein
METNLQPKPGKEIRTADSKKTLPRVREGNAATFVAVSRKAEFVIRLQAFDQNVEVRLGIVHEQNAAVRNFFHGVCASRK